MDSSNDHDEERSQYLSPVVSIILMLGLTVVLAAVIAVFVLGLGTQLSDTYPETQFDVTYQGIDGTVNDSFGAGHSADGQLRITHAGGDEIESDNLRVTGTTVQTSGGDLHLDSDSSLSQIDGSLTSGSGIVVAVNTGDKVRLIWDSEIKGPETLITVVIAGS